MMTEPMPTTPTSGATGATSNVSRRALLTTAGLGVCAATVVGAPIAYEAAQKAISDAEKAAFQAGINAIISEIETIEGIAVQEAVAIAELTRLAVRYIVVPVAQLVSTVGSTALDGLQSGVDFARDGLSKIGQSNAALNAFSDVLKSWRTNLTQLPKSINDYANADIDGAEKYLKSLQQKIDAAKKGEVKQSK